MPTAPMGVCCTATGQRRKGSPLTQRALVAAVACMLTTAPAAAECDTGAFLLRADFPGARMSGCEVVRPGEVAIDVLPEDGGRINPSPWYAFHVRSHTAGVGELLVRLRYGEHAHRYVPKISRDGETWQPLPNAQVELLDGDAVLRLRPGAEGITVAAQEILGSAFYTAWREKVAAMAGGAAWREIGRSIDGWPIHALNVQPDAPRYILLLGRQHPPEVSGALAMLGLVERLLERRRSACPERPAECRFFRAHSLVVVPFLNPDGVAGGHWRHNLGQTDLNRDWGTFAQPETQAVRDLVAGLEAKRRAPRLMLDFHSTRRNVFYTQNQASPTRPAQFAAEWLAAAARRTGLYEFEDAPRPLTENGTAKNHFYRTFGIPSITFEVADEERRDLIATSAVAFADALVEVLAKADETLPRCADFFCHMAEANNASLVMLAEEGLLSAAEAARIADAAAWVVEEQARPGAERPANYLKLEERLIELAGVAAANVHMGRSRQDLHGTTRRMMARDEWLAVVGTVLQARAALLELADREANTPIPAYTHGVQAQPTTFGHYLLAFSAALRRDANRLAEGYRRLNRSPLGAAALGTSGFALNRQRLAELLGFDAPVENSYDANLVSSADYRLELAGILAASAATIGQFAQNTHTQYHNPRPWILLHPSTTSGSSIMPQKRNPRPLDRLRSAASGVVAKAQALTLLTHNVNTGMHDYRQFAPLLELTTQAKAMYERHAALLGGLAVDAARAREELDRGFSTMTEVADVLLREADVPFRTAHAYASALADHCRAEGRAAGTLTNRELRSIYRRDIGEDLPVAPSVIREALDPVRLIASRRGYGGPQAAEVARSLDAHRASLADQRAWLATAEGALATARAALRRAVGEIRMDSEGPTL